MLLNFGTAIDKLKSISNNEYDNIIFTVFGLCGVFILPFFPYSGSEDFSLALTIMPLGDIL